ncbi:MAG: hypothetical protein G01um101425_477 [Candidatus Peregrinibacteria bacterium Gr01-1014_25]|nr:MAG: hypothetical protein G01um101425_477 [Candidatus Peregrinibacteria bacterium Gr01-1014_25]
MHRSPLLPAIPRECSAPEWQQAVGYRPSRRTFLSVSGLAIASALLNVSNIGADTRRRIHPLILVWLEGAASPWETFAPSKSDATEQYKGKKFATVDTGIPGIKLGGVLPDVAKLIPRATLIRSVDAQTSDHFISTQSLLMEENNEHGKTLGEVLGQKSALGGVPYSVLNMPGHYQNDPPTIRDHHMQRNFRFDFDAILKKFPKPDLRKDPRIHERVGLLQQLDRMPSTSKAMAQRDQSYDTAFGLVTGDSQYFDALELPEDTIRQFGPLKEVRQFAGKTETIPNPLAYAAATAHFMVTKGGAGVVTIHHCERDGWDMHSNLEQEMQILGGHLNHALAELMRRARTDGYAVVCMSEMGRTPKLNDNASRDHDPVHFVLGCGGKFAEGTVIGDYCKRGHICKDKVLNSEVFPTIATAVGLEVDPRIKRVREATT